MFRVNYRPIPVFLLLFAAGIYSYLRISLPFVLIASAAAAAAGVLMSVIKKKLSPLCIMLALPLGLLLTHIHVSGADADRAYSGESVRISGTVRESYVPDWGGVIAILDGASAGNGERLRYSVRLSLYGREEPLMPGDVVAFEGRVFAPDVMRNPGGYDSRLSLLCDGISLRGSAEDVVLTGHGNTFASFACAVRERFSSAIDYSAGDNADYLRAVLLGDKAGLDDAEYANFRDAGIAHVLAVSGLHIGFVVAAVVFLLGLAGAGGRVRFAAAVVSAFGFAMLAGFTPSVTRAAIMASLLCLFRFAGRMPDRPNIVSSAALCMLAVNPLLLLKTGFLLSFGAVAGIILFVDNISELLRFLPKYIRGAVAVTVSAQLFIIPFLAYYFFEINFIGIITNIFAVPFAFAAVVFGLAAGVIGAVFLPLSVPFGFIGGLAARLMSLLSGAAASLPLKLALPRPDAAAIFLFLAGLVFLSGYVFGRRRWRVLAASVLVCSSVVMCLLQNVRPGLSVTVLDVGQGDSACITYGGHCFIIDACGPADWSPSTYNAAEKVTVPYLRSRGITHIDAAFFTHADSDHIAGAAALIDGADIDRIYISAADFTRAPEEYEWLYTAAGEKSIEITPLHHGERLSYGDFAFDVMCSGRRDANDCSLLLRAEYGDFSMLFAGDAGYRPVEALYDEVKPVNILKAAHHGAAHGADEKWLLALQPEYAIISVGARNNYGHPDGETLDNLAAYGCRVLRTDISGAIEIRADKNSYRIYGFVPGE